ncbi:hypothetical protein BDZ90DRAFT_213714, partial [Jaminaea rosea]
SSSSSSATHILPALQHALTRLSITTPRLIPSPATQPRRASVALIIRVRPRPEDDEYLARQYDADGLPLPGSEVDRILTQSGLGMGQNDGAVSRAASQVGQPGLHSTLSSFFSLPWVKRGTPEILYIKRATRPTDKWSAHVAFPGGRRDETDEDGLYTAMRETWEEVGLDLADRDFVNVGQLDDREITSSLGKRLLMVLSPFVFIQTTPFSHHPELQPTEVASAHWVPLSHLYTPAPKWGVVSIDISTRLAPKSRGIRMLLQGLLGKMDFRCILLPNEPWAVAGEEGETETPSSEEVGPNGEKARAGAAAMTTLPWEDESKMELKLWGLTLGMTIDLLAHMSTLPTSPRPSSSSNDRHSQPSMHSILHPSHHQRSRLLPIPQSIRDATARLRSELHLNPPPMANAKAPSLTSVFPRFSNADVNFWIWICGFRYRTVIRSWQSALGTPMERRFNWSGLALAAFYSAVRRALIVALLLRGLGAIALLGGGAWWVG